jgi:hypothetical protein
MPVLSSENSGVSRIRRRIGAGGAMLALAFGLAGCSSFQDLTETGTVVAPIGHGPKVTFQNASTRPLEVRYWVGRRDVNKTPGGVDVMTPVAFQIEPGEQRMHDVGRTYWQTANTDAVVRVQVNLIDEDGDTVEGVDPWWFEFERPAPYSIRAVNASRTRQNLDFETWGEGDLFIVGPEEWIPGHNGRYPDYSAGE